MIPLQAIAAAFRQFFSVLVPGMLVPLACGVATVFVNIVLAHSGVADRAALAGDTPTVLDVSMQLIFIAAGGAISLALSPNHTTQARSAIPLVACFFALCVDLGILIISEQPWEWVAENYGLVRVWIPNMIGLFAVALTSLAIVGGEFDPLSVDNG